MAIPVPEGWTMPFGGEPSPNPCGGSGGGSGGGGGCGTLDVVIENMLTCSPPLYEAFITVTGTNHPTIITTDNGIVEILSIGSCTLTARLKINVPFVSPNIKECPPGSGIFINDDSAVRVLGNAKTDDGFGVCSTEFESGQGISYNCNGQLRGAAVVDPGLGAPDVCQANASDHCGLPVCDSAWNICGDSPGGSVTAYLTNHYIPGIGLKLDDRATNGLDPHDCSPCILLQGQDVTITVVDSLLQVAVVTIQVT